MNRLSLAAIWFLVLSLFPLHAFAWQGKVVKVADGDTITVLKGKEQIRVRLIWDRCAREKATVWQYRQEIHSGDGRRKNC